MTGSPGRGVPVRLLLVEDSENDAMLLLRELGRGGYEPVHERVYTPEGMERALEEAEARGEPYEVVISDYYMPRFRAPEALELLRGLGYDVPFIVVSGKNGGGRGGWDHEGRRQRLPHQGEHGPPLPGAWWSRRRRAFSCSTPKPSASSKPTPPSGRCSATIRKRWEGRPPTTWFLRTPTASTGT